MAAVARRLVVGVVLAAAALAPAAPASGRSAAPAPAPAASGACTDSQGVTVIVDFGAFGGGVHVRCAGWPVEDGYDALRKAGFTVTDTTRYPGLLCKIDGLPADQACVTAPPGNAHWGYSYAARGGSWTYSSQGALVREVPPGSVEGWAFGKGARPSVPPPAPVPTTAPPPPPTAPPPTAPAPAGPGTVAPPPASGPTTAPTEPDGPGPDGGADAEASADVEVATTTTTPAEPAREDTSGEEALGGQPSASHRPAEPDRGSPLPAVATGAAVVALVGGGALARRRRSRAG